jgi:TetR/AcrR family transcriptional repressor of nem operon
MRHNREGIVLNGMYYFWLHGYHGSGINDILKSCEIPKGSFYNFFESKEDFCIETLELYCNIMHTALEEFISDKNIPVLNRLKNFYMSQIEACIEGDTIQGCFLCNLSLELGNFSKKMRKELTKHHAKTTHLLEKCLYEAEQKNELNEKLDHITAAELLQNCWIGALLKAKATGKVEPLNEFLVSTFDILEY